MTESMDATDYSFYLAYGMTQEEEDLQSLLDVEMYNMLASDEIVSIHEAGHGDVLLRNT